MSAAGKQLTEVVPLNAERAPEVETQAKRKPPRCTISAKVAGPNQLSEVKLEQGPGALLAVLGDRQEDALADGEHKDAGPYALSMLNDVLQLALAGETLRDGPLEAQRVNAMLQQMAAFDPADELEGMIALQAVAMHRAAIDSARRGLASSRADHRAQYLGQANKCSRTFAALLEQLNRHRGKTTTQKFVFETHVGDGGQAVVGAAVGAGHHGNGANQPHGQTQARYGGGPRRAALFGAWSAQGDAVSAAGEQGQETLPHARRGEGERSAEGQPQQSEAWTLDGGSEGDAPASESSTERSAQFVGVSE